MMHHKKLITICSSASFYDRIPEIREELEGMGYSVLIPVTAQKMIESGDFDVAHYKTWFGNAADYPKKTALMLGHFDEVAKGDAILVLNFEKKGIEGYIGGNALMEMGIALYLKKPIFVYNDISEDLSVKEEILGMQPTFLHGDLTKIVLS